MWWIRSGWGDALIVQKIKGRPLATPFSLASWIFPCSLELCHQHTAYLAAAAAYTLQSCPILCDPMDRSPPGSTVHGILQARVLEWVQFSPVQFSSVAQSCPTLCDPVNRSTPGLPVHHQLPEFTQTHVHRVGDAIQPFHPLSFPSPPAPNPSQHRRLFQWVNSSHEVAKVL